MTAETFKKQILAVVEVWEDSIVFTPEYTSELRQRLEGATAPSETKVDEKADWPQEQQASLTSRFKQSTFKLATDTVPVDGEAMEVESDVDGEPVDDVDGEPVNDVDGEPLDDLDGESLVNGEPADIDGMPMDDVDGELVDDTDGIPIQDVNDS